MQSIIDALWRAYAALSVVPFVSFALVWIIVYWITKTKKMATKRAMDVCTFFLVGIVAALYNQIFQSTFGFYLLLLLFLLGFGLIGNLQQRSKGKIDVRKAVRAVWRLGFVALSALYIVFIAISLILQF